MGADLPASRFEGLELASRLREKDRPELYSMMLSFSHACVASVFGLVYLPSLSRAAPEVAYNCSEAWAREPIYAMCSVFVLYLLCDLALGVIMGTLKPDWAIHHILFATVAMVQLWFSRSCFPFTWLILGELSTVFLDMRWWLIGTGQTESRSSAFMAVQVLFALSFFATRVLLYGWGLWRLLSEDPNVFAEASVWQITPVALTAGYALNLFWFVGIVGKLTAKNKRKE